MSMRSRRFTFLATGLVALNLALWLAPQGVALRQAVINQLFGPRMIRAEVVVGASSGTQDYLIDRGVIMSVTADTLTLREQDGTTQTIPIASSTQVTPRRFGAQGRLRPRLRVMVIRLANAPATTIQVEAGGVKGPLHRAVP
jgi:hypothetical protein